MFQVAVDCKGKEQSISVSRTIKVSAWMKLHLKWALLEGMSVARIAKGSTENIFTGEIRKLADRWIKCIEKTHRFKCFINYIFLFKMPP
jgi:hypothetical protein